MHKSSLVQANRVLLFFVLAFGILYIAKPFFVPITIAGMLAMLFTPLCSWIENKGVGRGMAALLCIIIFILVVIGAGTLLVWQITDIASDFSKIEENISRQLKRLQEYLNKSLGVSPEKQKQILEEQNKKSPGGMANIAMFVTSSVTGFLVDTVLALVYLFLLLYFRLHLKNFVLKLVPSEKKGKAQEIITQSGKVAQQYLSGLGIMIMMLWVMYSIGFSIAGVKNALFFAILCGLLEIVPFIGNFTGTAVTLLMGLSQGGGTPIIIGILVTYAIVQFIQTYILEPLVVGAEVRINPLFTIIVLVVGELVWGIPGMVLAIPLLGIVKILFDHIEPLRPYAYLIGKDKKEKEGIKEKIKNWFK